MSVALALPPRQFGKYERLAHERNAKDLALCAQPGGHPKGLWFDAAAGEAAVRFVERYCRHHEGEWQGSPLLLSEWQRQIVRWIFGWKRPDPAGARAEGLRRYSTALVEVARKNGKTCMVSALGLYLMIADGEPGAQVYASATKQAQAKILWDGAAKMVQASPDLKRFVKRHHNNLSCERMGSKFEPLGADSSTLDGLGPHGNLVDELHEVDRRVWHVLITGMGARRQPLTLAITTAGTYDAESIGWELHDKACKVLEGGLEDDSFFAFIAAADDGDDFFSIEAQMKANPGYGISVKPDSLERAAEEARRNPSFYNEYLRLNLNRWTQQVTRWLSLESWKRCDPEALAAARDLRALAAAREKALAGKPCCGGLDLSTKLDLCALVLDFPRPDSGLIDLICRFWLPEATIEKYARKGDTHYREWADAGWLTATPGNVVDYEFIRAEVNTLAKLYALRELAYDPWGATDLATRLQGDGIVMVDCRQGYRTLSEPSKDFEAKNENHEILHAGNPVLKFCASNAVITTDSAGNIKPDKEKASARIDGIVAAIMARSRAMVTKPVVGSYLLTSDMVVLG